MGALPISIHPRIHDKPEWRPGFGSGWQQTELSLRSLVELVGQGRAFIAAAMNSGKRTSEAFVHSDLAVVDIDHGMGLDDFHAHPLAAHAAFLYTTSSHRPVPGKHRFRVGFLLPERISDGELYKSLITLLIRELGGDQCCSDPCRIFYGCSTGHQEILSEERTLPGEWIARARDHLRQLKQKLSAAQDYDPIDLEQAIYVLSEVLDPTSDGERDIFVRVTAAAASAGSDLYPAWSDWASRGHHGKGKNARQTSERFFKGFSGKSSLATLFYLAQQQDPNWRRSLPEHLRKDGYLPPVAAAGYGFEDFMGDEEDLADFDLTPGEPAGAQTPTPSILDLSEADWAAMRERQRQASAGIGSPAAAANTSGAGSPAPTGPPPRHASNDDPDDPFAGEPQSDEMDPAAVAAGDFDDSGDPIKKRKPGRPKGSRSRKGSGDGDSEFTIPVIKEAVRGCYPDLRLNRLTYNLEYGSRQTPQVIDDPTMAYIPVSEAAGRNLPKQMVTDIARTVGEENAYSPVRLYLEQCAKEATPITYFDTLAQELLGVEAESDDNPRLPTGRLYADEVVRRFLVGAVARALDPGCPHSWMPILVGPQNMGKSHFFEYLTPPHPLNTNYPWAPTVQQGIAKLKERPHILHAGWLVLLDEVERYFKRQYTEELKNLLSVATDRSDRKYENERSFPRSFVLCGATNTINFMVDPTGNRRFMPIRVPGKVPAPEDPSIRIIDLDRVKLERNGIWAAARQAYLDGEPHEFSSYELMRVEPVHSAHTMDDPLEGALRHVLSRQISFIHKERPAYLMSDIFNWLELPVDRSTTMTRQISDELRRMGYENMLARVQGTPTRFWQKRK
jgi:hypothetical protein